jgi:hypothetical protein
MKKISIKGCQFAYEFMGAARVIRTSEFNADDNGY